tara:strand:+ start:182 stop:367 length:186 start_codon:yes stop_codon:yes gene_type:complete
MKVESFKNYKKQVFKPVNERRKIEMELVNKKSVYKKFNQSQKNEVGVEKLTVLPNYKRHTE